MGDIHAGSGDHASDERLATAAWEEARIAAKPGWGDGVAGCAVFCETRGSHSPTHNASTANAATPVSAGLRHQLHCAAPGSTVARMRRSIA